MRHAGDAGAVKIRAMKLFEDLARW